MPTKIYPITIGCLSLNAMAIITAATSMMIAKSITTMSANWFCPLGRKGKIEGNGEEVSIGAVWFTVY
jgi:hypothetical protein